MIVYQFINLNFNLKVETMDIMEEIKFPSKDSEWVQKVLIGGIVAIIPIVNLIAGGYLLKVMKGAMDGKPGMPKWDDWGNLFMNGLMAAIIVLIYMIIPILILLVSAGSIMSTVISKSAAISEDPDMLFTAIAGALGGFLIAALLALIFGFLLPMALSMYVRENNFGAALRFNEVISRIGSVFGDYLTVFVIVIALSFVLGVLSGIPLLGFLVMIFGNFYTGAVTYNMFGEVCARSKS
jgi:hypothetical protein